jgi:hypothetical protein
MALPGTATVALVLARPLPNETLGYQQKIFANALFTVKINIAPI